MVRKKQSSKIIPKKIIENLLVPLDGSRNSIRALKIAINLAKFTNSKIIGLYVIPKDISSLPMVELLQPLSTLRPIEFKKKKFEEGTKIINNAKSISEKNKIDFSGKIIFGNPAYDIVKFSKMMKNKIDLIIIGSRGKGPTSEIFLGSVSNYVTHKAKSPVMIIK